MSPDSSQTLVIRTEFIELCQLLKFAGLVSSGGEGKQVVSEGLVTVNDTLETRKRRKIRAGDTVKFQGISVQITAPPDLPVQP